jgi:hypothetical protein
MVPGVQVSRIDANKWAISIRGSSGRIANKLLVRIDGRSLYTPLFGGVFWDVDASHHEFSRDVRLGATQTEVQREVYAMLTWIY